ncbi:MAG: c-type cytochrome [Betaproteobacteria bacterium]|nr:c-type cytochrome [Betaproteobacteria bacterium]
MKAILGMSIACGLIALSAQAAQPAAFGACAACHSVDGAPGLGPTLKDVYGRKSGSLKGFTFSPAMKRAGLTWDEQALDKFISDPQKAVPGNVMPFAGVADAKQRAEIISFLKTAK